MADEKKPVKAPGAPGKKGGSAAAAKSGPAFALSDGRSAPHPAPRLKAYYAEKVVPALMKRRGLTNPLQVPKLRKIVINIGVSEGKENIQMLEAAREELALVTGQWPQLRRAKKSISNFKLREGMPIGLRVTLRGDRMYEFLDRFISTAVPRMRDFRGLDPNGFDGRGNYNIGLREQMIFPEIDAEKVVKQRGMNISVVTSAGQDDGGRDLLEAMGFPFRRLPVGRQAGPSKDSAAATAAAAGVEG